MNQYQTSFVKEADAFWVETLRDYEIDRPLPLHCDRRRLSATSRTNDVWSITFNFDSNLSSVFMDYMSLMSKTLDELTFACYYVFLFKITNGERDLCVGRNIGVGYQLELHHPIDT